MNEMPKKTHLAYQIKQYRKRLNMTQEVLGEKMGYTKQTISYWEQGKHVPGQEDIIKLADIFSISPSELLSINPGKNNVRNGLESLGIEAIPNKVFTYLLFFKDNYENTFSAWIYDQDYPTMTIVAECCSKHNDFPAFKEAVMNNIDLLINQARDFMDSKNISEYAKHYRAAKTMIESAEDFAANPEK